MNGLTSQQAWAHEHITRCPCCGAWELLTEREKALRAHGMTPTICHHIEKALIAQEAAA